MAAYRLAEPIEEIYFDSRLIPKDPEREITFVDCGAYIGDTSMKLLQKKIFYVKNLYLCLIQYVMPFTMKERNKC